MKKFIILTVIAACIALCAAVWPQGETAEKTPIPTQELTVSAPKAPATTNKEETKVQPQAEKETAELPQPELLMETVPEPELAPAEMPVVPTAQPIPEPTLNPVPNPAPVEPVTAPQPDNMVYVPGFGWLESQGEGSVIHDEMMQENGNKVGSMD